MKNLDVILKEAKPAVPRLPEDFSMVVMAEIEQLDPLITSDNLYPNRVKYTQCVWGVLMLALSLLFFNSVIFEIQMNGSIELLYFGTRFLKDAVTYIPFDLILPVIAIAGLSSWLIWQSKAFKKGIAGILIGSILTTTFGGAALAATGINGQIQTTFIENKWDMPLLSWFYKERARFYVDHPNFRMGRVGRAEDGLVWIVDPHGNESKIALPSGMTVKKGQVISLVGLETGNVFRASTGRHCSPGRVGKYFSHMSMMHQEPMGRHHRKMHGRDMMQ